MKTVKVFVASSIIDFEEERNCLGGYVRKLNDSIQAIGHKVRLYLCEDENINSQPFYDRNIENSDIFIALIGDRLGEFTRHEILEVANCCERIRKKVLVLTSVKSKSLIPDGLLSTFEIHQINDNIKINLINLLSDMIEETIQDISDEPEGNEVQTVDAFTLNIPNADNTEVDRINNIIRRLRDQSHNIIVHENIEGYEQAYIALLSSSLLSEVDRIKELIQIRVESEKLWLYTESALSHQPIPPIKDELLKLQDTIINNLFVYPDYYESYDKLSILIENKLLRALIKQNQINGGGFIYIIEDHWLIRKSLTTQQNHLFINLYNIKGTPERKSRKERIILNLLNQYWLNGRLDKHVDAITKLMQGDFDSFTYSLDDLDEVKAREYGQAFYDYLCDILEQIHRETINHDAVWVKKELGSLLLLVQQNQFALKPDDLKKLYLIIGNTYSVFPALSHSAGEFYKKAISIEGKDPNMDSGIKELSKYYILVLCMSLFDEKERSDEEIFQMAALGLQITNKEDGFYFNAFKIIQYAASTDNHIQQSLENELNCSLSQSFILQSNQNLLLYLLFFVTWIQIQYKKNNDISIYLPLIEACIGQYNRYLNIDSNYKKIYETLCSKKALATKDLDLMSKILNNYADNPDEPNIGKHYYDLLYDKGSICLKLNLINDAILIFEELFNSYKGNYDKGASLQSLALCYMAKYGDSSCLKTAEDVYKKALELFSMLKDQKMCGNVWDGLSYCYLLQKKYSDAEEASLHSLEISEYDAPNKYANYISSLLCQNKKSEAVSFYLSLPDKEYVKEQFEKDWNNEMKEVGIDMDPFFELFEMQ